MIRVQDATTLALTKLRTRKVRLIITVVISGLLFSILVAASMVTRGVIHSINSFSQEGLGDRYIVQAYPLTHFDGSTTGNSETIERALAIQKEIVNRKKAEAKRLGIEYDAASEPSPVSEYDTPDGKQRSLDAAHPAAQQALQEQSTAAPVPDFTSFQQAANRYHATKHFVSQYLPYDLDGARLQVLKNGTENFNQEAKNQFGPPTGIDSFVSSWTLFSGALLEPFILPGQNLQTGNDGSIPVIVPNTAAEQLLQLKALPASASAQQRLDRLKEVRAKAPTVRFSVCYRNAASSDLVSQAVAIQKELEQNKNKKDYIKPDLIYGLPAEPCGAVAITRDVRTKDQKALADKERQFQETFGQTPPAQQSLHFRVVGIVPDADYGSAFGPAQIIRSLVNSSLGSGWYTPAEQTASQPLLRTLFYSPQLAFMGLPQTYYAEFETADQARTFIRDENCAPDYANYQAGQNPMEDCQKNNQLFSISPYGSNSLALESAKRTFGKIFKAAAVVVSIIAAVIMMGTVGRTIADSRRETAVFRAIGAKRFDIAQIYITYTIYLSLLTSLFAIITGFIGALIIHANWSQQSTLQAILAYNTQDLAKTFNLYTFHMPDLLLLAGFTLAAGLVGALLPLLRNLRRNPIRDMRDDT